MRQTGTKHLEEILVPFWQIPWPQATFGVRTAQNPAAMETSIAAAVHAVDSQIAPAEPKTLDQVREESLASERFTLILFGSFAVVALFLATLGIYGVVAFSVAQRSHEIAVRMALGATRNRVVALMVREAAVLAAIGMGLGLVGAYFVGRAMQSMLFGVHALDLSAFGSVGLILLGVGSTGVLSAGAKSGLDRADARAQGGMTGAYLLAFSLALLVVAEHAPEDLWRPGSTPRNEAPLS